MDLVRFTALDPYDPRATEREIEELIPRFHSVIDWSVQEGDALERNDAAECTVAVEYDGTKISDQTIEDALGRLGFRIQHVEDIRNLSKAMIEKTFRAEPEPAGEKKFSREGIDL